jgi:hypothetical protein
VVEIYPEKGQPKPYPKEERALGAPPFDLDRVAIPYGAIIETRITTHSQQKQKLGFEVVPQE